MPYNLRKRPGPPPVAVTSIKKPRATIIKKDPSNILVFGNDNCGELGLSKTGFTKKKPNSINLAKLKQIACGPMHSIALTEDGHVYTHGCNDEGALGRITEGDDTLEATPTLVELPKKVVKVTAGDSHSAVLTEDNQVYVWGNFRDEGGSVGLTPECKGEKSIEHIQLLPDIEFKDIASGSNHMLLLDTYGIVYSFGTGEQGQLGRLSPQEVARVNENNRDLMLTPLKVDLNKVEAKKEFICDAVYAGNFSSFATNTDKKKNRLAGWGLNNYYQLGYKGLKGQLVQNFPKRSTFTCSTSIINVACGQHHTLFLTKTGRVFAAGRNLYGMLGLSTTGEEVCPPKTITSLNSKIIDISASINTSFSVNDEGKLLSWGMGGVQLGHGDENDVLTPTEVESLKGFKVKRVSAGAGFTAVITE